MCIFHKYYIPVTYCNIGEKIFYPLTLTSSMILYLRYLLAFDREFVSGHRVNPSTQERRTREYQEIDNSLVYIIITISKSNSTTSIFNEPNFIFLILASWHLVTSSTLLFSPSVLTMWVDMRRWFSNFRGGYSCQSWKPFIFAAFPKPLAFSWSLFLNPSLNHTTLLKRPHRVSWHPSCLLWLFLVL